jgi:hypothetical protein
VLVVGGGGGPGGQNGFIDAEVSCPGLGLANDACPNAQIFDPSTGRWSLAAQMPADSAEATDDPTRQGGRQWPIALNIEQGLVLVAGGDTNSFSGSVTRKTALVFNPSTETWTKIGSMAVGRTESSTFVEQNDGTPLLLAAYEDDGVGLCWGSRITERFDQATLSFTVLAGQFPTDGLLDPCGGPNDFAPAVFTFGTNAALLSNGVALYAGGQTLPDFSNSPKAFVFVPPMGHSQ